MRPYNSLTHPRRWRAFTEHGNGIIGDMCTHMLDLVRRPLDLFWPTKIYSTGGIYLDKASKANTSDTQTATFSFPELDVTWMHRAWSVPQDQQLTSRALHVVVFVVFKREVVYPNDRRTSLNTMARKVSFVTRHKTGGTMNCEGLPSHSELKAALAAAVGSPPSGNGGFNLHMWATIVDRDGIVCAVAFTGNDRGDQWPGSRVISAQKANTANAFSLPGLALSTANLWAAVQPGGSLFGLQHSNPVDTEVAYGGNSEHHGQDNDPMCGKKIGGVNVFGGGLALYNSEGELVGAIGVSGDSSCADHNVAWRTRNNLALDHVPGGVSGDPARPDNIVFDLTDDVGGNPESSGGFGHPHSIAANADNESAIAGSLPVIPS